MTTRLGTGGRFLNRDESLSFTFDGKTLKGFAGDTLASALMASGQVLMGRSFKYHRPRGPVASGPEEPNALVAVGEGDALTPNLRATVTPLTQGLSARSQNRWPSLERDVGAINAKLSPFLPAGFYYKTFTWPRPFWKHVYEPFIRRSAGLGPAPKSADPASYEHFNVHTDLVVAGGGIAGLLAAREAGRQGKRVILLEQSDVWGGRAPVDGARIDGAEAQAWIDATVSELEGMETVTLRLKTCAQGVYDHGYVLAEERLTGDPAGRLWRIRTKNIVTATGAIERPLAFAGNDVPGVFLASAVRDYVANWAVSPGDRTVVVTNNDDAYRTALMLHDAGLTVPVIVDARTEATGALPKLAEEKGIRILTGHGIAKVKGAQSVTGVALCKIEGEGAVTEEVACDAVAMSGGWSPVPHLWSHCGGKNRWDDAQAHFAPDPANPPTGADGTAMVHAAGAASGTLQTAGALGSALEAIRAITGQAGDAPTSDDPEEAPLTPCWTMPKGAGHDLRSKMFLDYQNDVKVSDVRLAAQEGFVSVEHAKRYTTLGMATDQGKLSNINGLAILADAVGAPIPQVGTTTFRPPYVPLGIGAIAGEAKSTLFQPIRQSPIHARHEAASASFEPVGHWRRPYAFPTGEETREEAVTREIQTVRRAVGLLDASTLGKLIVKGPDAGAFMDMLYTNMMSTLPEGRCRYGLMCSENGFVMDDGVVARLGPDSFLCHTTTGGADRVHAHMEEYLQTEWPDMRVYTANVTEEWAQIAVAGPEARKLIEAIGTDIDLSAEAFKFMDWRTGAVAGIPARVYRISFTGELSYEIAVPAKRGLELWDRLREEGKAMGVTPYGTEAMHVMRAEKGYVMIGDETDGTVIPQDLSMGWAISKKKADYIGKRAQQRSHMADPNRWQLVGLLPTDGKPLVEGAYLPTAAENANGQTVAQGRVTSTYHSPTLGHGIAMALIHGGRGRMGDVVDVQDGEGGTVTAKVVDPVFYDPEGARQNV